MKTRIRKLTNEQWVGEVMGWFGWRAIERGGNGTRPHGDYYFHHCFHESEKEVEKTVREYMARQGI